MKKYLILLFSLLFTASGYAQTRPAEGSKASLPSKPEKENATDLTRKRQASIKKLSQEQQAKKQIKELKNGVLLVRLRTQENAIKSLEKANNQTAANKIRSQQAEANKLLLKAFQGNFTFCPVYFFYSSDSEKVKNGDLTGIFLDNNLDRDLNISLPDKPYFVAEITNVEQECPDPNNLNSGNNSEASFPALVMRDSALTQLADPFPFFVKVRQSFPPRKRTETELVSLLDKQLNKFYTLVTGGK